MDVKDSDGQLYGFTFHFDYKLEHPEDRSRQSINDLLASQADMTMRQQIGEMNDFIKFCGVANDRSELEQKLSKVIQKKLDNRWDGKLTTLNIGIIERSYCKQKKCDGYCMPKY